MENRSETLWPNYILFSHRQGAYVSKGKRTALCSRREPWIFKTSTVVLYLVILWMFWVCFLTPRSALTDVPSYLYSELVVAGASAIAT
ncbi:hypothetical protein ACU8KH_03216 [Lachancea thermotolerans]